MKFSGLMTVTEDEMPGYLEQCLQSLAVQTLLPDEVVLVENGALGADLKGLIAHYKDSLNIRLVKLTRKNGLASALNVGLKACSNELVARMDSDDICLPRRFEKQLACFAGDPDLDILGSWAIEIDRNGKKGMTREKPVKHEDIIKNLWSCPVIHPSVVFKKQKVLEAGGYDASLRRRQDYELWFRLAGNGLRFFNLPESLLLYRFDMSTHKMQTPRLALEQALIGYSGTRMLEMAWWKRLACLEPFLRSLLPKKLQRLVYIAERRIYSRIQNKNGNETA